MLIRNLNICSHPCLHIIRFCCLQDKCYSTTEAEEVHPVPSTVEMLPSETADKRYVRTLMDEIINVEMI